MFAVLKEVFMHMCGVHSSNLLCNSVANVNSNKDGKKSKNKVIKFKFMST